MSDLLNVLRTHEQEIARALTESLQQSDCPTLGRTQSGTAGEMLRTLWSCCQRDDETPARDWAGKLCEEGTSMGLPLSEVLVGLGCLERVVRFQIVKTGYEPTVLMLTLGELGDAVDLLRRRYAEAQASAAAPSARHMLDLVALAESTDAFICMATLHGRPFYLNPAGCRLLGLDEDDPVLSSSLHEYHSDESWKQLRDVAVPAVERHGQWQGRSQLRIGQTGETRDVLTTMLLVKRLHAEKPSCLAIVHSDAGEQVKLEEALAESQARKHAILESALDPIITIDHQGVITEFNRAAESTFGHARDKVLGTQPSEVLFPASASAGQQNRIDRYLDSGEGSMLGRRIEVTAVRSGGETFPAEMAMTISHEQGAPVLTFFVRDISLRKKAEDEQARYSAELERSNRELEQFAYVASHDLQEPLRKIRTFSDRLEMKSGELLNETGRECVQRMQSAATRMQVLIEGLLTLSRVTTRGQSFTQVDLAQVAEEVVSDLEVQIARAGGRVEVGRLPTIQADALQIRQLLQNLIGNALKFHPADRPPAVRIWGRLIDDENAPHTGRQAAGPNCHILVQDNGIGFDEKHLDRVFGVFQRLHPRDVYEGTGIGLAICRKIAERHGGSITARSNPDPNSSDQGTTFEVILPAIQPQKEAK